MSTDLPEFEIADSKTLTYQGRVDPERGSLLGPDLKGRQWIVEGVVYDPNRDVTLVTVERPELVKK